MDTRRAIPWIDRLRRRTTAGAWLPEIDGLRFIAIAAVVLFHIQGQIVHRYAVQVSDRAGWIVRAIGFGHRGVPLFFSISGFILGLPFARHALASGPPVPLRKYFLRRLTRLEPPYLFNLLVVACGAWLLDHQALHTLFPHLVASAVYLHYAIFREPSTINSVAWSLEVEAQFYLVAPLLALIYIIRSNWLRRAAFIVQIFGMALLQGHLGLSMFTLAGQWQYFVVGMLLADLYLTSMPNWLQTHSYDVLGVIALAACFLGPEGYSAFWLPASIGALFLGALRGRALRTVLQTPAIALTGGMCYSIYLWHAPVLTLADRLLRTHRLFTPPSYAMVLLLQLPFKLCAVGLAGLLAFVFLERPCMDPDWPVHLRERLRSWRRVIPPDDTPADEIGYTAQASTVTNLADERE